MRSPLKAMEFLNHMEGHMEGVDLFRLEPPATHERVKEAVEDLRGRSGRFALAVLSPNCIWSKSIYRPFREVERAGHISSSKRQEVADGTLHVALLHEGVERERPRAEKAPRAEERSRRPFPSGPDMRPILDASLEDIDATWALKALKGVNEDAFEQVDPGAYLSTFRLLCGGAMVDLGCGANVPSVAGMVLFGHHPRAVIPGAWVKAEVLGERLAWEGPVVDLLAQAGKAASALPRTLRPILQEALLNAILHRSWEEEDEGTPIRLTLEPGLLEVGHPGRIERPWGATGSFPVNKTLFDLAVRDGHTKGKGKGLKEMARRLAEYGAPPLRLLQEDEEVILRIEWPHPSVRGGAGEGREVRSALTVLEGRTSATPPLSDADARAQLMGQLILKNPKLQAALMKELLDGKGDLTAAFAAAKGDGEAAGRLAHGGETASRPRVAARISEGPPTSSSADERTIPALPSPGPRRERPGGGAAEPPLAPSAQGSARGATPARLPAPTQIPTDPRLQDRHRLLLMHLRERGPRTTQEIVSAMGWSRPKVRAAMTELVDLGLARRTVDPARSPFQRYAAV